MTSLKVLLVGPSLTKSKGGIASVIKGIIENNGRSCNVEFKHIVSHVGGNVVDKFFILIKAIVQVVLEKRFDIIHIHVASDISIIRKSVFVYLGYILNKPVIMHVHGAEFDIWFKRAPSIAKKFVTKTFSICAKVLVLSDYWKSFFIENNFYPQNIEVMHNGVHTEEFKDCISNPLQLTKFLFLGRLGHRKGVYDLLEAINILVKQQHHEELKFFLAGDGDIEQVRKIVEQRGLTQNVQILGWLTNHQKKEWLSQVGTVILPSYSEGLPMAIIEAMASGKVILSSYTGGIPDMVRAENGFLIKPGDVARLCGYISYIQAHPEVMDKISFNNVAKISKYYDSSAIKARLFEIYTDLTKMNNSKLEVIAENQYSPAN